MPGGKVSRTKECPAAAGLLTGHQFRSRIGKIIHRDSKQKENNYEKKQFYNNDFGNYQLYLFCSWHVLLHGMESHDSGNYNRPSRNHHTDVSDSALQRIKIKLFRLLFTVDLRHDK